MVCEIQHSKRVAVKYRTGGTDGAQTVSAVVIKEVFSTNLHNDKTFMYSIQEGDGIDSMYSISIFLRMIQIHITYY